MTSSWTTDFQIVYNIDITSFCIMDVIAMLYEFRFMDVVGERGYGGTFWAKFAPVLMHN